MEDKKKSKKTAAQLTPRLVPRHYQKVGETILTKQEFASECDINNILATYHKSGQLRHLNNSEPQYGFASGNDFRESLEIVRQANEQFATIPSEIRAKFANNPELFLDFATNPSNEAQMIEWGLSEAPPTNVQQTQQKSPEATTQTPQTSVNTDSSENTKKSADNADHSST